MISPIGRCCIWFCFFLLAFVSGDHGMGVWAETSYAPGGVKINRYPNMDAPGNDATWVRGVASVEECESLCLADGACAGYTYNIVKSTCIPKTAIGPLSPTRESAVTGIVERRGGGQSAQGRAIMVEGKPSFDCRKAKSDTAQTICGSS
ncbi:MAG: PAN domain-containing protein, partial [Methylocella sp.]